MISLLMEQYPAAGNAPATYPSAAENAITLTVNDATQFAAHGFDAYTVLEKAATAALQKAKPGTPEFRTALRDATETMGRTVVSQGVLEWTPANHWGFTNETGVMLQVVGGEFKIAP